MINLTKPKNLFLLDGVGAFVSIIMLGGVLVALQSYVGIPKSALYILAAIPIFFLLFDVYSYMSKSAYDNRNLKVIATLNSLYCICSLGMTFYHRATVTMLGWLYILSEIFVLVYIVYLELKSAK